jgi:hypothetical protein
MRRSLALVVLLPLLAAACGGGGNSTSSTAAAPDPGAETMRALIAAAAKGDRAAIWSHLSAASQKRLGPTYPAFARGPAASIEHTLRPFASLTGKPLVSERLTDQFGVVAVRKGTNALALALRKEGGAWKAEMQGPVNIDIGGPQPGSRTIVGQIGVEVHAPGPPTVGFLWVDGTTLNPNIYPGPTSATIYGNLAKPLPPGTHTAVAFAQEGRDATALAWTFTATKS